LSGKPVVFGASITATGAGTDTGFGRGVMGFGLIVVWAGRTGVAAVPGLGKGLIAGLGRAGMFGAATVLGFVAACTMGLGAGGFTTGRGFATVAFLGAGLLETTGFGAITAEIGFADALGRTRVVLTGVAIFGAAGLVGGFATGLIGLADALAGLAGLVTAVVVGLFAGGAGWAGLLETAAGGAGDVTDGF
jgi:hypothetical protein